MSARNRTSVVQASLWVCLIAVTTAVIGTAVYTNITLRSIEKNLPTTLLVELNSLAQILDNLLEVVTATRIAEITNDEADVERLRQRVEAAAEAIARLRQTYVIDNLVNASAFHAIVAPAIADMSIWLAEGISGYPPSSPVTLDIAHTRIYEAYQKANQQNLSSRAHAQEILDQQMRRLDQFQTSVTILFVLTLTVTALMILMLVRQTYLVNRESKARSELERQHHLFESLLQNLPLGVAVWDKGKNILHLNRKFTEITGYNKVDMPHLSDWALLAYPDPAYRARVRSHWKGLDKDNRVSEYRVTCKDGTVKDIEFRAVFLPDSRVFNTFTDVTEKNRRERALQESRRIEARARKMESLGLLAGGVAHDLNNILSGIVSYPELLLLELSDNDKMKKSIEVIHDSGKKAAAIVQDLLTVARGVAIAKEPLNINTIIAEYLNSPEFEMMRSYHPEVTVDASLTDDLKPVLGSRAHLRKVIMNLITNGCEAMERPGTVLVSTENRSIDRSFQEYDEVESGEFVLLTIADEGSGIDENDLERIFEPFYTKKVMGRSGTGLGLAVVWNVIQDHNGHINVASSTTGTTFTIYLPVTSAPDLPREKSYSILELQGNGESILVVDDIDSQRLITSSILEKLNYRVETVSSGEAAIAYVKQHPVDLLLLDMIMDPGLSGRETYQAILQDRPGQKAIIVSGYAETEEITICLELGASAFLKKPLKLDELGLAIKEALGPTN